MLYWRSLDVVLALIKGQRDYGRYKKYEAVAGVLGCAPAAASLLRNAPLVNDNHGRTVDLAAAQARRSSASLKSGQRAPFGVGCLLIYPCLRLSTSGMSFTFVTQVSAQLKSYQGGIYMPSRADSAGFTLASL